MSEITAITPQVKDKTRCNIFVDGRFYCGLTLEAAVKNRLKAGQTIDPDRLGEIQLESERSTALDKALHFIAASQKTSGISAAFMLAFINSFNNIPVSMFLTGPGVSTFPATLMNYIEYNYDPAVSAVSVLLMAATVIIMVVVDKTLGIASLAK